MAKGLIAIQPGLQFAQVVALLACNAHGPLRVIVPNQQFGVADLVIEFTCSKGERHTFQYVRTANGEGFLTEIPEAETIVEETTKGNGNGPDGGVVM